MPASLVRLLRSNSQTPTRAPSFRSPTGYAHSCSVCLKMQAATLEISFDHALQASTELSLGTTLGKNLVVCHYRFVQRKILQHGKKPFIFLHCQTGATTIFIPAPESFSTLQHPRHLLFCSTDTKASYMLHQTALQSDTAQAQAFWPSTLVQCGVMQMHTSCLVIT